MKMIINIPGFRYDQCKKDIPTLDLFEELVDAVKNGTPLNECDSDHIPTITIPIEEYMKLSKYINERS